MNIEVRLRGAVLQLAILRVVPTLIDEIKGAQEKDSNLHKIRATVEAGTEPKFKIHDDGSLRFENRVRVPNDEELKRKILKEAHNTSYTVHPGSTKMYRDLKGTFWWNNMKRKIAQYVAQCLTCK